MSDDKDGWLIFDNTNKRFFVQADRIEGGYRITWDTQQLRAAVFDSEVGARIAGAGVGLNLSEGDLMVIPASVAKTYAPPAPPARLPTPQVRKMRQEVRYESFEPERDTLADFEEHINDILSEGWRLGPLVPGSPGFIQALSRDIPA